MPFPILTKINAPQLPLIAAKWSLVVLVFAPFRYYVCLCICACLCLWRRRRRRRGGCAARGRRAYVGQGAQEGCLGWFIACTALQQLQLHHQGGRGCVGIAPKYLPINFTARRLSSSYFVILHFTFYLLINFTGRRLSSSYFGTVILEPTLELGKEHSVSHHQNTKLAFDFSRHSERNIRSLIIIVVQRLGWNLKYICYNDI